MAKSNVKRVRPSMVFTKESGNDLIGCATPVAQGILADAAAFRAPAVDGPTLEAQISAYGIAYNAFAGDGGKKALAEKNKQEHALKEMLRKNAHYVEGACNQDMGTFLLSGFQPVPIGPVRPQLLAQPSIVSVEHGDSTKLIVVITRVAKTKVYELQYGVSVAGATPISWSTVTLANAKPATVSNLIPGMAYQFQVRAFGALGWTEWSDPITRMCA